MHQSPSFAEGILSYSIKFDGKEISDAYLISSIWLSQNFARPAFAELLLVESITEVEPFGIANAKATLPGTNVEISLGYDAKLNTVFKGKIIRRGIDLAEDNQLLSKIVMSNEGTHEYEQWLKDLSITKKEKSELKLSFGQDILSLELFENEVDVRDSLSRYVGDIEFQGSDKAEINTWIEVEGLGSNFSKEHFISGVEHLIEEGNWVTNIKIGLSSDASS